jgi:hypothetical protein
MVKGLARLRAACAMAVWPSMLTQAPSRGEGSYSPMTGAILKAPIYSVYYFYSFGKSLASENL